MRVKEIDHGLELALPAEGYVRTPGLHASDLYGAYYRDHDPKRYDKRTASGDVEPMDLLKLELGLTFEQELEDMMVLTAEKVRSRMAQRLFSGQQRWKGQRPGEFTSPEGVIFSPDYLFYDDNEIILGEFKLTWYSATGAPTDEKFSKWICQCKLYLHWLQMTKVRLFAYFVNDCYKPPKPKLRAWEIVFTRRELEDECNEILRHARKKGLIKAA